MTPQGPAQPGADPSLSRRSPPLKSNLPGDLLIGGATDGMALVSIGPTGAREHDSDPDGPSIEAPAKDAERTDGSISRSLETINELTGRSRQQIREGFRADPPRTLADQAAAEGVSQDDLVAAIVADTQLRLHEAVAAGKISQERAGERLANLDRNVMDLVATIPTGLGSDGCPADHSNQDRGGR